MQICLLLYIIVNFRYIFETKKPRKSIYAQINELLYILEHIYAYNLCYLLILLLLV